MPILLQVIDTSHIGIYTLEILSIGMFIKMKFEKNVIYLSIKLFIKDWKIVLHPLLFREYYEPP